MKLTLTSLSLAVIAVIVISPASAQPPAIVGGVTVQLDVIADVAGDPLSLKFAPNDPNRLFVASQNGVIDVIENGNLRGTPFLNIDADTSLPLVVGSETGLLGFAFHPNFAASASTPGSRKVYTYTSEDAVGTPDFTHPELGVGDHHSVIREWTVASSGPIRIDTNIAPREVMRINQPQANHNGGDLAFDTSGNLYISLGDGGGGNDNEGGITNPTDGHTNLTGNAQDTSNVYGKILRINPLGTNGVNGDYGVPASNPFVPVGEPGLDEIYAYGLRNPFRISFDRATGDLYTGDVGQQQREEVDLVLPGENYGWVYFEGTRTNRSGGPAGTEFPVGEYTHSDGNAIIGGWVSRGSLLGGIEGQYVFGDLAGNEGLGRLFHLNLDSNIISEFVVDPSGDPINGFLHGFGEGPDGSIYALFTTGEVVLIGSLDGDANLDGEIDIFDVGIVSDNWLTAGPAGDVDNNQAVNIFDVGTISENWTGAGSGSVPEPGTLSMLAVGLLTMAGWRWRRARTAP